MAQTPLTSVPAYLTAGDSLSWLISLADYPASDGWILTYTLINAAGKITLAGSASGDDHAITKTAATTAGYAAGDYTWTGTVSDGTDRHTVGTGRLTIKPDLAAQAGGYEARSTARKALDDLRAALATWIASNGQVQEYTIAGRVMKYASAADIEKRIRLLEKEVAREDAAEKLAAGMGTGRRVLVRF